MSRLRLVLLLAALLAGLVGIPPRPAHADAPIAGRRVALVIGNGDYRNVDRLPNAASDARLIAETLRDLHFTLVGGDARIDLDRAHLAQAVQDFGHAIAGAEVTLFYYSGHGLQVQGVNWLVPIDANPTRPQDLDFQMVDADLVLRQMDGAGTKLNLVLLDACRNNPFGKGGLRALQPGLAEMRAPEGTLISYATQPGNVAMDGTGANSPYTTALAAGMRRPGLDIFRMFNQVGLQVKRTTDGSQQPWVSNSPIDGDFYFVPQVPPAPDAPPKPGSPPQEALATPPPPLPSSSLAQPSPSPVEIARDTVRAHPCSVLDARMAGAAIEISGIAVRGAEWDALAAAIEKSSGASRGLRPGRFDVEMLPAFACKAVEALAPAIRRARDAGGPRLLAPPRAEQTAGQQMAVTLRVPAGGRVTADLFRPPNAVEHLAVTGAGDRLVIPLPAGAPPGPRVLSVVVSNEPLDLPPGSARADAAVYLAALGAAMRASPDAKADMAAFALRAPVSATRAESAGSPPSPPRLARPGRCAGILERAQLGEPLSDADRTALRGECR